MGEVARVAQDEGEVAGREGAIVRSDPAWADLHRPG